MNEWTEITLGEISNVQTGPFGSQLHASDYVIDGVPCIMPRNIGPHLNFLVDDVPCVGENDVARLKKHKFQKGDIVYSRRGDVEKCAYVTDREKGWLCGTGCLLIRITSNSANSKFISYQLSTPELKGWITSHAVGTTMPNLNTNILQHVPLSLPPIREQLAIVEVLSSIDEKMFLLHRNNKTLQQLAEALFRLWFDLEEHSSTLGKGYLGDFFNETIGGEWGKEFADEQHFLKVKCIRGTDIGDLDNGIPQPPTRFVKELKFDKCKLQPGDIVIEISGGTDDQSTGRSHYVDQNILALLGGKVIFSNFCRLLRPVSSNYTYFLSVYLSIIYQRGDFFNLENGTSGIKNLDLKSFLYKEEFNLPTKEQIETYNKTVSPLFTKVTSNLLQIQKLETLRDMLLPKLMSGSVSVTNSQP